MDVPPGNYRFIAGRAGAYRYQYWNHTDRVDNATILWVPDPRMDPAIPTLAIRFDLAPLNANTKTVIAGTVLAMDPTTDGPPQPLADADVLATPILPDLTAS